MKHIMLMGNPNVGKSAVFSRLTGVHVVASNYPGTTVEYTQGALKMGQEVATLIDVPGTYGLEATSKAEEIAIDMLKRGDVVINVVDATNLERNLHLTLHLLEESIPVIIALNIWDDAKHKGIVIDVKKMEELLGVPVVPTVGITGEGIKELVLRIPEAVNPKVKKRSEEERWAEVGRIVNEIQTIEHRHHTLLEVLSDLSVKPVSGLLVASVVFFLSYEVVRRTAETLIGYIFDPFFEKVWQPLVTRFSSVLNPDSFIHHVIIGKLIEGNIDFVQSFGVLTTGLYVPVAMVLPYVFSFYLVLGFLEDFGYLPRLAVLFDSIMHRMGLHGWAIIPSLLGLGCNVPGIMASRILESRKERLISATIISIGVPCAALQAMIWGLLGNYGARYVIIVYSTLFFAWFLIGRIMKSFVKGYSPELIMEIPPYRLPSVQILSKKVWMRMVGFFKEALPIVLLGVALVNILYYFKVFNIIADFTSPLFTNVLGLPKDTVLAMAIGFLRKDVAVGMLGVAGLTAKQLTIACTVLAMSFPCVATFVVIFKELGLADMLKSVAIMLSSSIIAGALLNIIL